MDNKSYKSLSNSGNSTHGGGGVGFLRGNFIDFLEFLSRIFRNCFRHPILGSVLIEFAFSIPIIITLLFFVNDHFRFYELREKIKSSTYFISSMLQNISNTRSEKQLTYSDMRRIVYISCFNLFHTKAMFSPYPFGIFYIVHFHYVKRVNNNEYIYNKFIAHTGRGGSVPMVSGMTGYLAKNGTKMLSEIRELHPDLVCNKDGEERLLIISAYGATQYTRFNKSKLGFLIFEPNFYDGATDTSLGNFFYKLVITLKPGLFPLKNE